MNVATRRSNPWRILFGIMGNFLSQGLTPGRLAITLSVGLAIGCFPLLGITTILCGLVAIAFRLNLPAIQAGNYLALPLQILLFVPFGRLGERMFRAPRLPVSPRTWLSMTRSSPDQTARLLLSWQYHAIAAWLLFFPVFTVVAALLLRPLLDRILLRMARRRALPAG